jgi:SAM-dependent methyltransferase
MNFYATIARYYDSEHADKDEDFAFYSELASEADGPILIIGSGTGRIALHLAEQGHTVHGIEIESAMFQRAEAHLKARPHLRERVTFHHADAVKLKLDLQFDLVILPYNTFMHFLTMDAQLRLLARVEQWVKDGGALALDLPNAADAFGSQDTEAIILERTFIERDSGHLVMQQSSSGAGGALTRTVVPVQLHYYFFNELWLLLEHAGLEIEEVYGDFDRSEFVDGCPRMIVVAR